MLRITLENEHGIYVVQDKDVDGATVTYCKERFDDTLRAAGYVIDYDIN